MAKARTLVKRLKAVRNIRKITRTMELIATARFKKAMDRAVEAEQYTKKIAEIVADLAATNLAISHPLLQTPQPTGKGVLLVLTSNRGLCGGYNSAVLRQVTQFRRQQKREGREIVIEVSGKRGISYMKFEGVACQSKFTHFEDKPAFEEVEPLAERYAAMFINGEIDRLDVAYTKFISASRQTPMIEQVLPFTQLGGPKTASAAQLGVKIDYEFLPSADSILKEIVPAAFRAKLFKFFLDAAVSEQIARMVAMKGATENADDMINILKRNYNRARQSQITSELSEIIGGAAALE